MCTGAIEKKRAQYSPFADTSHQPNFYHVAQIKLYGIWFPHMGVWVSDWVYTRNHQQTVLLPFDLYEKENHLHWLEWVTSRSLNNRKLCIGKRHHSVTGNKFSLWHVVEFCPLVAEPIFWISYAINFVVPCLRVLCIFFFSLFPRYLFVRASRSRVSHFFSIRSALRIFFIASDWFSQSNRKNADYYAFVDSFGLGFFLFVASFQTLSSRSPLIITPKKKNIHQISDED